MKIASFALLALASTASAFTPTGTVSRSSTVLYNGMDAYAAQMAAALGQAPPQPAAPAAVSNAYSNTAASMQSSAFAPGYKLEPRWRKKTKQLATLGPASDSFEMIERLFLAGADVFRLNFSHGEHAQKGELLNIIRQVEAKHNHPIAVLGDLQGPKLRVGKFANPDGEILQNGQPFRFDLDETPGNNQRVLLPHPEIIEASQVGHMLLIDDGKVAMQVTGTGPGYIDCVVTVGGKIKDKKVSDGQDSVKILTLVIGCQHSRLGSGDQSPHSQRSCRLGIHARHWCRLGGSFICTTPSRHCRDSKLDYFSQPCCATSCHGQD